MKLILLLISFNLYAATPIERLAAIDIPDNSKASQEYIARLMFKCSIPGNSAYYYNQIIKPENNTSLVCFESKRAEIDTDREARNVRRTDKKSAYLFLKNYNCSTLQNNFMKALCRIRK